jgi:hypothetical protein
MLEGEAQKEDEGLVCCRGEHLIALRLLHRLGSLTSPPIPSPLERVPSNVAPELDNEAIAGAGTHTIFALHP